MFFFFSPPPPLVHSDSGRTPHYRPSAAAGSASLRAGATLPEAYLTEHRAGVEGRNLQRNRSEFLASIKQNCTPLARAEGCPGSVAGFS